MCDLVDLELTKKDVLKIITGYLKFSKILNHAYRRNFTG